MFIRTDKGIKLKMWIFARVYEIYEAPELKKFDTELEALLELNKFKEKDREWKQINKFLYENRFGHGNVSIKYLE